MLWIKNYTSSSKIICRWWHAIGALTFFHIWQLCKYWTEETYIQQVKHCWPPAPLIIRTDLGWYIYIIYNSIKFIQKHHHLNTFDTKKISMEVDLRKTTQMKQEDKKDDSKLEVGFRRFIKSFFFFPLFNFEFLAILCDMKKLCTW